MPRVDRPQAVRSRLNAVVDRQGPEVGDQLLRDIAKLGRRYAHLVESLDAGDLTPQATECLKRFQSQRRQRHLVVREKDTGIAPGQVDRLLMMLESFPVRRGHCELRVELDTPQVYVYGLCAIAAWANQNASSLEFEYHHERVQNFLHKAGVIKALQDPASDPIAFDDVNLIGFTRIDPSAAPQTDVHAARLVKLFERHADLSHVTAQALATAFAELIENCIKHGKITSPAWLLANYHPQPKMMHVCICDRGIGVRRSFLECPVPEIAAIGQHPTDWIKTCTEALVTSKTTEHAGYGLYIVRELCRRNKGQFLLISQNARYNIWYRRLAQGGDKEEETIGELPAQWNGTLLALMLNLAQPIDLGPIYRSLPAPRGYEGEDVDLFR